MKRILLTVLGFLLVTITFGQSKLNIINQTSGATIYFLAHANPIDDACYPYLRTVNRNPDSEGSYYLFPGTTSPSGYSYVIDGFNGFSNTNYDGYNLCLAPNECVPQTANQILPYASYLDWFRFGIKVQGGAEYNNTYGAWLDFGDDPCQSDTMNQSWAQPQNNPVSFGFIFKIGGEIFFVTNDNL